MLNPRKDTSLHGAGRELHHHAATYAVTMTDTGKAGIATTIETEMQDVEITTDTERRMGTEDTVAAIIPRIIAVGGGHARLPNNANKANYM